jgi:hypothetical protein
MADPTVRVEGASRLRATLRAAGGDLGDLKDANARAASMVAQWAAVTAPRRTGALGASVRAARQVGRARVVAGSTSVPYAGPINYGWPARNVKPQPFINNAAVQTQPAWLPVYLDDIQKVCDTVKGA